MGGGKMRNSARDEFEKVYLRYTILVRTMEHANLKHTESPSWEKCVNYVARKHYFSRKMFYTFNGFELEDIISISKTFSIAFFGLPQNRDLKEISYSLMMRFIRQKLSDLVIITERKFRTSDVVAMFSMSPQENGQVQVSAAQTEIKDYGYIDSDSKTPEEIFFEKYDEDIDAEQVEKMIGELKAEKEMLANSEVSEEERKKLNQILRSKIKNLKGQLKTLTPPKEKRFDRAEKKKEIADNKEKYIDSLCYHATSKHIDSRVRKAAVRMCQKLGIDHVAWLKKTLSENLNDSSHYIY
jgi:hypothetical protein